MSTDLTFITNEQDKNLSERFKVLIKDTKFFENEKIDCLQNFRYDCSK